jgi:hypothetical protein
VAVVNVVLNVHQRLDRPARDPQRYASIRPLLLPRDLGLRLPRDSHLRPARVLAVLRRQAFSLAARR